MSGKLFALFLVAALLIPVSLRSEIEEEVSVNLIEIWVKATDGNNHVVTDLSPDEFEIYIDGKKKELRCFDKSFDEVQVADGEEAIAESGRIKRTFIFFFDLLNSSSRDIDYLRGRVADFLRTSFRDDDQGMVFVLLPNFNLGVVQKMTSNREILSDVISKMKGNPSLERRVKNNEKELLDVLYAFGTDAGPRAVGLRGSAEGSGGGGRQIETIRQARGLARTFAAQEMNQGKLTLGSFLTIAEYLQGFAFSGRLVMLYVSGGFPLHPGLNYYEIVDRAVEDTMVVGNEDLVFRDRPDQDFEREVRTTIGLLNRLNVTIYSIDANGMLENDRGPDKTPGEIRLGGNAMNYGRDLQDTLSTIAYETGGLVVAGTQNYDKELARVASDMGQQYWLCANLPEFKKRGDYHKIEIKVTRPGIDLRYRKGYSE
jgi:VWFA-related protein